MTCEEARQRDVRALRQPCTHVVLGQALGRFARAGIAEASGPERDALPPGELLDPPVIEQTTVPDHRSSSSRCRRAASTSPVRRRAPWGARCCGAARGARSGASRSGNGRAFESSSMPTSLEMTEADLHGRNAQVVQRAVFETRFARRQHMQASPAPWRSSRCRRQTTGAEAGSASHCGSAGSPRRWGSRTSCRTRSSRNRALPRAGRGGWSARTPPRRAARASRGRARRR